MASPLSAALDAATSAAVGSPQFWNDVATRSQVTEYTNVAAWAWLVWDWFSTFDDEVTFVWMSKWSLSKALYIITRYFGLFVLTIEAVAELGRWDAQFCGFYFTVVAVGTAVTLFLVEIGMQFRIYALYNGSKKVLMTNGVIFLVEVIVISALIAIERTHHLKIIPAPAPLVGCWNTEHPQLLLATWFIALGYEVYLFSFVAYKAYLRWKEEGELIGMFSLMFRDAVLWFVFIAALLAWNAFAFFIAEDGYIFLGLPFLHAASSIGGSRLVIDIRKAWADGKTQQSSIYVAPLPIARQAPHPGPSSSGGTGSLGDKAKAVTMTFVHRIPGVKTSPQKPHKLDTEWHDHVHGRNSSEAELIALGELRNLSGVERKASSAQRQSSKWFGGAGRSPPTHAASDNWVRGVEFAMQVSAPEPTLPPPPSTGRYTRR